ncbi:ABC transporter ATP-binding protein [Phaeovulum vinaykumarii]|uniref:Iron-regulated ABC transporter ATPase subunit SufC n=1 Tax=Phaeovulum vinaykumarii TaxID=407234 RepID=A0A1N7N6D3_9RHOB|nr:ABC transporter ATP-binding protein [Phaeovulum vinaykumarii]SIS93711.1 Iron-regulated ABC transporter ATPase subunit SufC [Phaeovulum vinaykumarii]SOC20119.1 Iron-regulated ABC transporter ATPase subunit SufC [Phaeovulum vinaykumarii]
MTLVSGLEISGLDVEVDGKPVLSGIDLSVPSGELHVLLGPNGSGKSSLLAAIMGLPPYRITAGEIRFNGQSLNDLPLCARARLGIGMAFQRPPGLEGVTLEAFAAALSAQDRLTREAAALDLADFTTRQLNVGFSGGEIKRWEILKLMLQDPRLVLFDEPESGVDLEHVIAVGHAIDRIVRAPDTPRTGLVITHTGTILNHVTADRAHILRGGRVIASGAAPTLFAHVQTQGYTAPAA